MAYDVVLTYICFDRALDTTTEKDIQKALQNLVCCPLSIYLNCRLLIDNL